MLHQWHLANIRCQGCARSIYKQLSKLSNITDVRVMVDEKLVEFIAPDEALVQVERCLKRMGYVRAEDQAENNGLTVARSVMSCLAGKLS